MFFLIALPVCFKIASCEGARVDVVMGAAVDNSISMADDFALVHGGKVTLVAFKFIFRILVWFVSGCE